MTVGPVSPYSGLEPAMWRNLLARAAVFHALRAELAAVSDHVDLGGDVHRAIQELGTWARECAARDIDDDETVTLVVQNWDVRLTEMLALLHLDEGARELLARLQVMARLTRSSDPFDAIFTRIATLASGLYGESWRSPTLDVFHIRQHPRGAVDPYAITATTPWPPDNDRAQVELKIHSDGFGPAAFAALPMLLIHECICHVPARQDKAGNDSSFAEGLLDWMAHYFHDLWAVKLDVELAAAALKHGTAFHMVLSRHGHTAEGKARLVGHQAARDLRVWFETHCDHEAPEAEKTVALLAVQLNMVDRPLTDKDRFVSAVGRSLPPALEAALHAWEARESGAEVVLDAVAQQLHVAGVP